MTAKVSRRTFLPVLLLPMLASPLWADNPALRGQVKGDGSRPPQGFFTNATYPPWLDHPTTYYIVNDAAMQMAWPLGNELPPGGGASDLEATATEYGSRRFEFAGVVPSKRLQFGQAAGYHIMQPYFIADQSISCPQPSCIPPVSVTLYAKWGNVEGTVTLLDGTPLKGWRVDVAPKVPVPAEWQQMFRAKSTVTDANGEYSFAETYIYQDDPTYWQCNLPQFNATCVGLPFDINNNWGLRVVGDGGLAQLDVLQHSNAPGQFEWSVAATSKKKQDALVMSSTATWIPFQLSLDEVIEELENQPENRPPNMCAGGGLGAGGPVGGGPGAAPYPVSLITGNVFLDQTDAQLRGLRTDVFFTRSYNSHVKRSGVLGRGWNHAFEQRIETLTLSPFILRLWQADGSPAYFTDPDQNGSFTPAGSIDPESTIVRQPDGSYRRGFRVGGYEDYRPDGKLLAQADRLGRTTTLTYSGDLVTEILTPEGRKLTLEYLYSSLARVTGPEGLVAEYSYNSGSTPVGGYWQQLRQVRYPDGTGYTFSYNPDGKLLVVSDLAGVVLHRHGYDGEKAAWSELNGGREHRSYTYDAGKTIVTDARGAVSTFEFTTKKAGRFVTKVTGCGFCGSSSGTRIWDVDDQGRVTRYVDADDKETIFTWQAGNLVSKRNPLHQLTTYSEHDQYGRPGMITRVGLGSTRVTYAPEGVETVELPTGQTSTLTYQNQRLKTIQTGGGLIYTLDINDRGDLLSVTDPRMKQTTYTYDGMGRRKTMTSPLNLTTKYTYDAGGRLTSIERPDGKKALFTYDASGRLTSVTDEGGRKESYSYDAYDRPEAVVDALGGVTRVGYDIMSNLTSLTDAKSQTTGFEYDDVGRVTAMVDPLQGRERYTYYPSGRLWTRTDRKNVETTYTYDDVGRLLTKTYTDGTPGVTVVYNDTERRVTMSNGTDTVTWEFDQSGRLLKEGSTLNGSLVESTYTDNHQKETVSLDGVLLAHSVYVSGYLDRIQALGQEFTFGYDDLGRRTSLRYPNALETRYDYNPTLGWLEGVRTLYEGSPAWAWGYTHDTVGNRVTKTTPEAVETYGYDGLYRLTGVGRAAESWDFAFDAVGNRTWEQTGSGALRLTHDARNRLLGTVPGPVRVSGTTNEAAAVTVEGQAARALSGNVFETDVTASGTLTVQAKDPSGNERTNVYQLAAPPASVTYTHDANGNMTGKAAGTNTWTYDWNAENELVRVCQNVSPCTDANATARFKYDPLGRRVEKVAGGKTYRYVYDGIDILRETITDGATTTTYRYVHGPGIDEPLARQHIETATLHYYHADGLGSIVRMTDSSRQAVLSRQYDAWGNPEAGVSAPGFAFTGREWDPETGLYYYRARYYDPTVGRFISEDPIGFRGGINFYAYVAGSPVNTVDPDGLVPFQVDPKTPMGERMANMSPLEKLLFPLDFVMPLSVSAKGVGVAARLCKPRNLPAWRRIMIDMDHIASGHMKGGSRVTEATSKSLFPEWMTAEQVEKAVREAYRYGQKLETQGERVLVEGTSEGLTIRMWINKTTNEIETAFPIWGEAP